MPKPWELKVRRRTSANAPIGSKCGATCVKPTPAQAHCSVCHQTFGGVWNFDRHRKDGWCQEPSTVGLQLVDSRIWKMPLREGERERLEALGALPLPGL